MFSRTGSKLYNGEWEFWPTRPTTREFEFVTGPAHRHGVQGGFPSGIFLLCLRVLDVLHDLGTILCGNRLYLTEMMSSMWGECLDWKHDTLCIYVADTELWICGAASEERRNAHAHDRPSYLPIVVEKVSIIGAYVILMSASWPNIPVFLWFKPGGLGALN